MDKLEELEALLKRLFKEQGAQFFERPIPRGTKRATQQINIQFVFQEVTVVNSPNNSNNNNNTNSGTNNGTIGNNNRDITVTNTTGSNVDPAALLNAIIELRGKLTAEMDTGNLDHLQAVGKVAEAEQAAKEGDSSKAIQLLKGAGGWVSKAIQSAAAGLLKDVIVDQMSGGGTSV